jgi:hypothetical protein
VLLAVAPTRQERDDTACFHVSVTSTRTNEELLKIEYEWEKMMHFLNHIEGIDFDEYEGWMKPGNFDDMYPEDDVHISLHCGNQSWDMTFPIGECLVGVRSHPMFIPHRNDGMSGTAHEANDEEMDVINEILKSLEEMATVRPANNTTTAMSLTAAAL